MTFDMGAHFKEYVPKPQASQPVTDLSPHVDGGQGGATSTNVSANTSERAVLHGTVAIIAIALALLWLMGALAFKGARL